MPFLPQERGLGHGGEQMNWSIYQSAIFDAVEQRSDSLIIEAVSGKTKRGVAVECKQKGGITCRRLESSFNSGTSGRPSR